MIISSEAHRSILRNDAVFLPKEPKNIGRIIRTRYYTGEVLVYFWSNHEYLWLPAKNLSLSDRSLSIGDVVYSTVRSRNIKGTVVDLHCKLRLKSNFDLRVVENVSSRDVQHVVSQQLFSWFVNGANFGEIWSISKIEIEAVSKSTGKTFTRQIELPIDWEAFGYKSPDFNHFNPIPPFLQPGNTVFHEGDSYTIKSMKVLRFSFHWICELDFKHEIDDELSEQSKLPDKFFEECKIIKDFEYASFSLGHVVCYQDEIWTICGIETLADVLWQNGTLTKSVSSLELYPLEDVEDLDYFPLDVVSLTEKENSKTIGIVTSVDSAANTLNAIWFDSVSRQRLEEREVSIFSVKDCPECEFRISYPVTRNSKYGSVMQINPQNGMIECSFDGKIEEVFFMDLIPTEFLSQVLETDYEDEDESDEYEDESEEYENSDKYEESEHESNESEHESHHSEHDSNESEKELSPSDYEISDEDLLNFIYHDFEDFGLIIDPGSSSSSEESSWETVSEDEISTLESSSSSQRPEQSNISFSIPAGTFSLVENAPSSHYYFGQPCITSASVMRAISKEASLLSRNLPPGIFVRQYENRMDLLSLLIIGCQGTPYEGCPFSFDIFIGNRYPNEAPKVFYLSFVDQKLNPNLYENGRICLSLLGTWEGESSESWVPGKSNLLQVFISLQSLVLNESPYFNEAGYESLKEDKASQMSSSTYSQNATILSLQSLLQMLSNVDAQTFNEELKKLYFQHGLLQELIQEKRRTQKQFSKGYLYAVEPVLKELEQLLANWKNEKQL